MHSFNLNYELNFNSKYFKGCNKISVFPFTLTDHVGTMSVFDL